MTSILLTESGDTLALESGGVILLEEQVGSRVTRVDALDPDGNLVGIVPFYERLTWTYELGQDGAGTVEVDALDTDLRSTLRAANMLRVQVDGTTRAGIVLRREEMGNAAENPTLTLSGKGPKGLLAEAAVYPPGGLGSLSDGVTTRRLDWTEPYMDSTRITGTVQDRGVVTSPTGSSDWDPAEWVDSNAHWLWADDGTVVYLALDFTTASAQQVRLESSADDEADIYLDGAELLSMRGEGRHQETMQSEAFQLASGSHRLAIRAEDTGGTAAGVIASLMGTLSNGEPDPANVIARTDNSGAWVGVGDPARTPGMLAGEVINLLVDEAQARGAIPSISVDLTDTEQSPTGSGVSWVTEYAFTVQVGASVSKALDQLIELGPDIWVTGDPMVQAVDRKGTDKSATVSLRAGRDVRDVSHSVTRTDGNLVLAQTQDGGWSEHAHSSTQDASIGRREYAQRSGSAPDASAVADLVNATFESHAIRIVESTVTFEGGNELVVHQDFELGDDVSIPSFDSYGGEMSARVLSISGEASADSPQVSWTVETQETQ